MALVGKRRFTTYECAIIHVPPQKRRSSRSEGIFNSITCSRRPAFVIDYIRHNARTFQVFPSVWIFPGMRVSSLMEPILIPRKHGGDPPSPMAFPVVRNEFGHYAVIVPVVLFEQLVHFVPDERLAFRPKAFLHLQCFDIPF